MDGVVSETLFPCRVRRLGRVAYAQSHAAMRRFTERRDATAPDELWMLEHDPVYTLGLSCRLAPRGPGETIPVVASDRGGQITYHGPGQIVVYVLLDLKRRQWGPRRLVGQLEQAVIDLLADYRLSGQRQVGAPGVYVDGRKIASLGLRVRRGCTYHGLSLNVAMDLAPFRWIDPCGYADLEVTQLSDLGVGDAPAVVQEQLLERLTGCLALVIEEPGAAGGASIQSAAR